MVRELQLKHLCDQTDLKVCRLEEDCKTAQLQVQNYEREHQQLLQTQQQRQQEEQQIQIQYSDAIEQLRLCKIALEEHSRKLEVLQLDCRRMEALHQQKLAEKEEVIDSSTANCMHCFAKVYVICSLFLRSAFITWSRKCNKFRCAPEEFIDCPHLFNSTLQQKQAERTNTDQLVLQSEPRTREAATREAPSKHFTHVPPPPPALPVHIQQQSIR
jgi:hypothetical protein